jgi:Co/Zn/Cd efflux system component
MEDCERIVAAIQHALLERFHITHSTVQLERAGLPREAGPFMPEGI